MRVALLTNFVPPYRVPVLRELQKHVGELRIFASTPMEKNRSHWKSEYDDLDVVVQKTWTFARKWQHERFTEAYEMHIPHDTVAQLRRFRPQVIISGEFGSRTMLALLYGSRARVPVVIWATLTDHLEPSRGRVRALVRRVMAPHAAGFMVNGEAGARYLHSLGIPPERVTRVPQAVDVSPFLAAPVSREPARQRHLLFSGAIAERKGADLLADALRMWSLKCPGDSLTITMLGDGPLRDKLERAVQLPNVTIQWAGAVAYEDLPGWYQKAGLLIFPTQGDEWGLVVNEALASAVPVMGSDYSQAVEELIVDGHNGWRFRPDNPAAIVQVLERGLNTPDDVLQTMRQAARTSATDLTPARMAHSILSALKKAMK